MPLEPTLLNCRWHGWVWGTWMVLDPVKNVVDCVCGACHEERKQHKLMMESPPEMSHG